jgi:hypothetical protein
MASPHNPTPESFDPDAPPASKPRNGKANAGLLLSIAALIMPTSGIAVILTAVAAIVLSVMGLRRAFFYHAETGTAVGRYPATIGLAMGVAAAAFALWTFTVNPAVGTV